MQLIARVNRIFSRGYINPRLCRSLLLYWGPRLCLGKEPAQEPTAGREGRDAGAAPRAAPAVNRNAERLGTVVLGTCRGGGGLCKQAGRQSQHTLPRLASREGTRSQICPDQTNQPLGCTSRRDGARRLRFHDTRGRGDVVGRWLCVLGGVSFLGVMPPPLPGTGLRAQEEPMRLQTMV